MKHLFKNLFGLALAAVLFSSCDKITGDGSSDPEKKTDIRLVGNWNVTKYEAYDTRDSLIMTMTSQDSIYTNAYHRFDFDVNYWLIGWKNGKQFIGMDYSYEAYTAESSWIRFGDIEWSQASLSETYLNFNSIFFAPDDWLQSVPYGPLKKEIDYVKIYCTKAVTQEQ